MVTLVCITVYENLRPKFTPRGGCKHCRSDSQQIVAMQYICAKCVACVITCVVYACCGCFSLQLIAHLSTYQTVGFALDYRVPAELLSFHGVQSHYLMHS